MISTICTIDLMNTTPLNSKISQSQLAILMGFTRKRKKLKEFSCDMKFSNHDVFLSFTEKIRSGGKNRQNYRLIHTT
ncbi:hypothetical protein Hanom_Chr08g00709701 [Helianthus anomalus]